ncbi:hypothetical protein ACFFQF_00840 [Haladaptatus pallidirubidus]|nr:hypothetical protein [Haladaptatus pallidirubidus]
MKSHRIPKADVIEAVEQMESDEPANSVTPGVHPSTVAEYLDIAESTALRQCRQLAEEEDLKQVTAWHPATKRARTHYMTLDE